MTGSAETEEAKRVKAGNAQVLRGETPASAVAEDTEQVVITTRGDEILRVERVDKNGVRSELSEQECRRIAGENELDEVDAAIEEAFEAGIDGVLGDEADEDELFVQRLFLLQLIGGPIRRRVGALRQKMLRQLLMRRLIRRRILRNVTEGAEA